MNKERMTPGQAFRLGEITAEAVFAANPPPTKEEAQLVVSQKGEEFGNGVVELIRKLATRIVFLSLAEQFERFCKYNEWLKAGYRKYAIQPGELEKMQAELANLPSDILLFYCHNGDVVLTAKLAWEYTCSCRQKTRKLDNVRFEPGWMEADDREPKRPAGFYWLRRPAEDTEAIGRKFQSRKVLDVRQELDKDWGMGCEGLQFAGITHTHYPDLMDGDKYPFIDLPGLAVVPYGVGDFFFAPCLVFRDGGLWLYADLVGLAHPRCGSGFLQPVSN